MERACRGARILLVDADVDGRASTRAQLEALPRVREVREAADPAAALFGAREADLVIVEIDVPGTGGLETVRLLRRHHPACPVVVLAVHNDPDAARASLDLGARSFLLREATPVHLEHAVGAALQGSGALAREVLAPILDRYGALLEEARRRDRAVIASLAAAVEAKDAVTSRHLSAVSHRALALAELVEPELADDEDFLFGCLLHDIGKIGVPESILAKPGPLDDEEWEVMRRHPLTGAGVVGPLGLATTALDVVLHHHERWDGTGYPRGLAGADIPLAARIFSVCDALDAMTADRPYRRRLPGSVAFERVRGEAGRQFDPEVVAALERGVATGAIALDDGDPELGDHVVRARITGGAREAA
jgi:response regulator RpfG family c-di-GMP phosphodiesterase